MNPEQVYGPLRAIVPVLTALLVGYGLDDVTAGLLAGGIVMIIAAAWSFWSNRPVAVAQQVTAVPGVEVVVGPSAPQAMKQLAADPNTPGIVAKR